MTHIILKVLMMRSGGRKMMIKNEIPLIMCLTQCWNCNNVQSYLDIIDPEHKKISPPPWQELAYCCKNIEKCYSHLYEKIQQNSNIHSSWKELLLSPDEFIKANSQEEDK